ncbi:MAG: N-acetyl-gamma-glutamyl-phosphate reductase [Woeseiaceae bacterium]|nr:N-acetyl-gamma-glutamyl-phosphate reductase [Woeseiaceae bacterium]
MTIQAAVLGATGYVGGELLRLLAAHPEFEVVAAVSDSRAQTALADTFPHLKGVYPDAVFASHEDWVEQLDSGTSLALFSAAPHGMSAAMIAEALSRAAARNIETHVVDASADFRYADRDAFKAVYSIEHGAPELLDQFSSGLPEHVPGKPTPHIGNPGCFATAMLLGTVPLLSSGLVDEHLFISGITGSTGSGRNASAGTHHPERHSNLYAYKALEHRHAPEVAAMAEAASGTLPKLHFVPHSGPYARGIHATIHARLNAAANRDDMLQHFEQAYAGQPFIRLVDGTPRLKNVVASNYAEIGVAVDDEAVVAMVAIDNLVKGAAGGAVQWMNRLWDLDDARGLEAAAPAWT